MMVFRFGQSVRLSSLEVSPYRAHASREERFYFPCQVDHRGRKKSISASLVSDPCRLRLAVKDRKAQKGRCLLPFVLFVHREAQA
jgi:hypothetical protein